MIIHTYSFKNECRHQYRWQTDESPYARIRREVCVNCGHQRGYSFLGKVAVPPVAFTYVPGLTKKDKPHG